MTRGDRPSANRIPVAEPTEELPRRGRSDSRRRIAIVLVVLLCVVAAAIPVTIRLTSSNGARRQSHVSKKHVGPKEARVQVGAALAATIAARSYRISSLLSETAPPGAPPPRGPTFRSDAIVNVEPLAMVATADVAGLVVTSWTDGTRQWELGGANYGLTSPAGVGPGQPISGFTSLVTGTLGNREGGVAMMGLSSPHGHLDLTEKAITSAAQVGTTTLDGAPLTEYEVKLDASVLVSQPGMTAEQVKAATDGFRLLQAEGYSGTTERIGVDAAGYMRESHTVWSFADGGSVIADTTFSDYGCAGTVVLPTQSPQAPPASTCTSPDPAATTPTTTPNAAMPTTPDTTASATATTGPTGLQPLTATAEAAIVYAYGHFFDPDLTADERLALVQGSAAMRDSMLAAFSRHLEEVRNGAIVVDAVSVNGDTAKVSFHALYHGQESPANPGQLSGTAVLENGTWKLSRDTFCTLSANDGEPCS